MARWDVTIPLQEQPLSRLGEIAIELDGLGYTGFWTGEVDGVDGLTPLAALTQLLPQTHLGTAILPAYTRGPAVLAQTAASMAGLAPGRFAFGIGASSPAIVHQWNAMDFDKPYARARDTLEFLREALTGARIDRTYETFRIDGFRLSYLPEVPPSIYLAALRPRMIRLGAQSADGVILNWLSSTDMTRIREIAGPETTLVARLFVCPSTDARVVRETAKRFVAAYLNVPTYAQFHRWLGREPMLGQMWERWSCGDRKGALAAIPDEAVDQLFVHGTPEQCRAQIEDYVRNGATVPVLTFLPFGRDPLDSARAMAPSNLGVPT